MKKKRFGQVYAMDWRSNDKPRRGVSIVLDPDEDCDEFSGEWITTREAKRFYVNLGKALRYIEEHKKKPKTEELDDVSL